MAEVVTPKLQGENHKSQYWVLGHINSHVGQSGPKWKQLQGAICAADTMPERWISLFFRVSESLNIWGKSFLLLYFLCLECALCDVSPVFPRFLCKAIFRAIFRALCGGCGRSHPQLCEVHEIMGFPSCLWNGAHTSLAITSSMWSLVFQN